MIICRRWLIVTSGGLFFLAVILINVYFVYTVIEEDYEAENKVEAESFSLEPVKNTHENLMVKLPMIKGKYYIITNDNQLLASVRAESKIRKVVSTLAQTYKNESLEYKKIVERIVRNLKQTANNSVKLWKTAEKWVTGMQVLPEDAPLLGSVLNSLCSLKIIKAENSKRGTQLKLLLTLEGGQQAVFKPQWKLSQFVFSRYHRNKVVEGSVYAGRDRHNGEVAAFHLSLLLNLRRVPLTVGRKIDLRREIMPVASEDLLKTFHQIENNTCFYGVCVYCEPESSVCAKGDIIEGALIMWLPHYIRFEANPNPWRRTYKKHLAARWEVEENYCERIKDTKEFNPKFGPRLLDLIDAVVFDFLLDNGDRHHYEVPIGLYPSTVFLFDNGKSFGNPNAEHLDILAPLYQCCLIRKTTWERLKTFSGGNLGASLEKTLRYSHISPVLTRPHLMAIDKRLFLLLATVETCIRENGIENVLI